MKLFTIGYGGRSAGEFTALLSQHGIRTVVDVRLRPDRAAMGTFAKAKTPDKGIERVLRESGIDYVSFVELGNVFVDREDWALLYRRLLDCAGDLLVERLLKVPTPFCLTCCEKSHVECHRAIIAECLVPKGWAVEHL
jgi:uncharacterized protein (DUF488 family)